MAGLTCICQPGTPDNEQTFEDYGTYEVHLGGSADHDCLVTFNKPATVEITVVTDHDGQYGAGPDEMTIEEVGGSSAMTLTIEPSAL